MSLGGVELATWLTERDEQLVSATGEKSKAEKKRMETRISHDRFSAVEVAF